MPTTSSPYTLFNLPPARTGQETQQAAAAAIAVHAPTLRAKVLAVIKARGAHGATNEEISALASMLLQTVGGRVAELRKAGQIHDSGERRAGRSGVKAKVWVAV